MIICHRVQQFRNKLSKNRILFLQETHSIFNNENIWRDNFDGPVFYYHAGPILAKVRAWVQLFKKRAKKY